MQVDVCLSPALYPVYKREEYIVVVIDILRASTAMCTAFEHGVSRIKPVATVEEAQKYKNQGYLVGAERNGEKLDGFDFGNSPYSYMTDKIKDQTIVLTTTNGTRAIDISKNARQVVIGAFTNFTSLCDYLTTQESDVLLLCAGWKDRFNLEDSLFAGAVVDKLTSDSAFDLASDSALCSQYLFQMANEDTYKFLHNSSHRRRLARLNLKEDIKYSFGLDKTSIVPILKDGYLVNSAD